MRCYLFYNPRSSTIRNGYSKYATYSKTTEFLTNLLRKSHPSYNYYNIELINKLDSWINNILVSDEIGTSWLLNFNCINNCSSSNRDKWQTLFHNFLPES